MITTESGWRVEILEDSDCHLNIYIESPDGSTIEQIETGQGDGVDDEQLALRFTTHKIEKNYVEEWK